MMDQLNYPEPIVGIPFLGSSKNSKQGVWFIF